MAVLNLNDSAQEWLNTADLTDSANIAILKEFAMNTGTNAQDLTDTIAASQNTSAQLYQDPGAVDAVANYMQQVANTPGSGTSYERDVHFDTTGGSSINRRLEGGGTGAYELSDVLSTGDISSFNNLISAEAAVRGGDENVYFNAADGTSFRVDDPSRVNTINTNPYTGVTSLGSDGSPTGLTTPINISNRASDTSGTTFNTSGGNTIGGGGLIPHDSNGDGTLDDSTLDPAGFDVPFTTWDEYYNQRESGYRDRYADYLAGTDPDQRAAFDAQRMLGGIAGLNQYGTGDMTKAQWAQARHAMSQVPGAGFDQIGQPIGNLGVQSSMGTGQTNTDTYWNGTRWVTPDYTFDPSNQFTRTVLGRDDLATAYWDYRNAAGLTDELTERERFAVEHGGVGGIGADWSPTGDPMSASQWGNAWGLMSQHTDPGAANLTGSNVNLLGASGADTGDDGLTPIDITRNGIGGVPIDQTNVQNSMIPIAPYHNPILDVTAEGVQNLITPYQQGWGQPGYVKPTGA
jgi:hypothetical protein